jgi:anti-sigma B factor antagonist
MARLGGGGGAEAQLDISLLDNGATVVTIVGELDISNINDARAELRALLEPPPPRIVFDVTGLEFMDSSGLALLLQYSQQGEEVRLYRPTSVVRRIVDASGLAGVLRMDD